MVLSGSAIQALKQSGQPLAEGRRLSGRAARTGIGDEAGQQAVQAITEPLRTANQVRDRVRRRHSSLP